MGSHWLMPTGVPGMAWSVLELLGLVSAVEGPRVYRVEGDFAFPLFWRGGAAPEPYDL
jgi:hypothetical protein